MKFIKNILITFSTQIIMVILDIATGVVIARVLGPSGKGAYALILLVPSLLALLGNLGISIANVYFGGSRKQDWTKLASNSLISAVGLGFLLAAGFLVYFHIFQPSFLGDIEPRSLVLATLVLPLSLFITYFTSILLGQGRIKEYNLVFPIQSGALLVLVLFLLLAARGEVFGTIAAWASATLIAAIFSILLVRRTTNIKWSFYLQLFKDSVKFGIKGYFGNIITFLTYRLNWFILAFFVSTTFIGYYSVSVAMAEALWYFPGAVGTLLLARTPGMKTEEANASTPRVCRNTLFLTVIASLLLFVLGRYVISLLYGSDFLPAVQPLWILLPGVVALSIPKVLSNEIAGRGRPIVGTIAAGVTLAVNIPLNLLFIPRMGISGAALATTISYIVGALVVLAFFLRISKNSWADTLLLKREDLETYRSILSTARILNVKYEATALTKQAFSLVTPEFWRGRSAGGNSSTGNKEQSIVQRGKDKES